MESRILFISTYPELTTLAKQISTEMKIPLTIFEGGIMKNGHLHAKKNEDNYDVIISQGGTAAIIKSMVNIPVVSVEINIANFINALIKAKECKTKIGLISYPTETLYDLESLKRTLDIDFEVFQYSNERELKKQVEEAIAVKRLTLVGMGSCIVESTKDKNVKSILIKSDERAVRQAIISAKNIVDLGKREKERAKTLKAIIDYSEEGIVAVDKNNIIVAFNPAIEKILGLHDRLVVGSKISNFLTKSTFAAILGDGDHQLGELTEINGAQVVINRIPIVVDDEKTGIVFTLQRVSRIQKLEHEVRNKLYNKGLVARYTFNDIKGESMAIRSTIEKAIRFGKTSTSILIEAETGCGKELFAQSIHNISTRKTGPFVAVNCAALPESLLESELFGYEDGAFTGAKKGGKPGLFELSHGGTIFLDEIGEMPLSLQSRLLRVLEEKEVMRIGGDYVLKIDTRVIAATNLDLYHMVEEGKFREDLYFRINVLNLKIPAVRERREDIPVVIRNFIKIFNQEHSTMIEDITDEGMNLLKGYNWPGNVREIRNFIEKLIILANDPIVDETFISKLLIDHVHVKQRTNKLKEYTGDAITEGIYINIGTLKDMELQIIEAMNNMFNDDKEILAHKLGISRTTLWKRLKELNCGE